MRRGAFLLQPAAAREWLAGLGVCEGLREWNLGGGGLVLVLVLVLALLSLG